MDSPEKEAPPKKEAIPALHRDNKKMDIRQVSEKAKEKLAEALQKKSNAVISISKEAEYWLVTVEMVDEEYLPGKNLSSMNDILAVYEVKLSDAGELLGWTKKSSHKRGKEIAEIR